MAKIELKGDLQSEIWNIIGDPEELFESFRGMERSLYFVETAKEELRRKYLYRWVAIYEGAVVADAETAEALQEKTALLHLKHPSVMSRYIDDHELSLVL